MKTKRIVITLVVTLSFVTLLALGACGRKKRDMEQEVAIAVALTQTAVALEQETDIEPPAEATATSTPSVERTVVPLPITDTPTPTCTNDAEFIKDITIPDYSKIEAGATFTKTWLVKNTGTCSWEEGYQFTFLEGDHLGGPDEVQVTEIITPDTEYTFSVGLTAPEDPGTFKGTWQLYDSEGEAFGQKFIVAIEVPQDVAFRADRTSIRPGECAEISWNVENVNAVYFYEQGDTWDYSGVAGQDKAKVCPKQTTTYELRILHKDDTTELKELTIEVSEDPEVSLALEAERTSIKVGECVDISWRVQNVKAVYFYKEGKDWEPNGVGGEDKRNVCPPETTTYLLRVVKHDDEVETRQVTIQVSGESVITAFSAERTEIEAGECVTISWNVEHIQAVYFYEQGEDWEPHGVGGEDKRKVCPEATTVYELRAVKEDDTIEIRQLKIEVK